MPENDKIVTQITANDRNVESFFLDVYLEGGCGYGLPGIGMDGGKVRIGEGLSIGAH